MSRRNYIIAFAIIVGSFALSMIFYAQMPEQMATHWGISGEPNGYMSKFWGLFLLPFLLSGMLLLFILIPKIDPLRKNIEKFRKEYDMFIVLLLLFLFFLHGLMIAWNAGLRFDMGTMIAPLIGALFYAFGVFLPRMKRNWFIGIRTPWTMSSDEVWEKTHKLGSSLFRGAGAIAMVGAFFPRLTFYFVLIPILFAALYPVVHSYFLYKKIEEKELKNE